MKLDLSKFKKVKESDHEALMQHPDGHHIRISKKILSKDMRKSLEDLPVHKAEGGMVEKNYSSEEDQQPQQPTIIINNTPPPQDPLMQRIGRHIGSSVRGAVEDTGQAVGAVAKPLIGGAEGLMQGLSGQQPEIAPQPQQPIVPAQAAPAVQQPAQPFNQSEYMDQSEAGMKEKESGIYGEAKAIGQEGKSAAAARDVGTQHMMEQMARQQELDQKVEQHHNEFMGALQNNKINPNQVWENKSVLGKVSTAIGLILGGAGGGLMHTENPALKFLNDQINRDIEAQEKNMSKQNTLLNANLAFYRDRGDAIKSTESMYKDIMANEILKAADLAKDPVAKQRAAQAAGQFKMDSAALRNQVKLNQFLMNSSNQNSDQLMNVLRSQNPELAKSYEERYVPGMGFALNKEGAKSVRDMKSEIDSAYQGIDRLLEINKISGKSFNPNIRAEAQAIQTTLIGQLRTALTGPGAMSEGDRKLLESAVADPTKMLSLDSSNAIRLNSLKQALDRKLNSAASSQGLKMKAAESQDDKALKWANANASDPRAIEIKKRLGK